MRVKGVEPTHATCTGGQEVGRTIDLSPLGVPSKRRRVKRQGDIRRGKKLFEKRKRKKKDHQGRKKGKDYRKYVITRGGGEEAERDERGDSTTASIALNEGGGSIMTSPSESLNPSYNQGGRNVGFVRHNEGSYPNGPSGDNVQTKT